MANCRAYAKSVAEEGRLIQRILVEYIVAKEEIGGRAFSGVPRNPGPNRRVAMPITRRFQTLSHPRLWNR